MNRTVAITVGTLGVLALVGMASTGSSLFGVTGAGRSQRAIAVNDVKPSECASIVVTVRIVGSGTVQGGNANELLLGRATVDTIAGGGGNDCLVGGGGNDSLNGGSGTDVCLGGPGTDTFNNSCETRIQ